MIAVVFANRIKRGMRLQTDPTVIYGMGEKFDGNIRKRDLTTDTPWNTYTRDGLPPTPIAMPGAASIARRGPSGAKRLPVFRRQGRRHALFLAHPRGAQSGGGKIPTQAMSARGRFITVEGIDGAGKSSHLEHLCARVRARGAGALLTREPGGTAAGERLREVVLHQPMTALAEALVMFGARSVHVTGVIEPALAAGMWVVCDRFSDSTYAYQCGGRGLEARAVASLEGLVHPDLQPDATFLFDLDPAVAYERQRARSRTPDKFENEEARVLRARARGLPRARAPASLPLPRDRRHRAASKRCAPASTQLSTVPSRD